MLFGLVTVKAYGYWWGYTAAQIELMVADVPLMVYDTVENGQDGNPSAEQIEQARRKWENRYRGKTSKIRINDILNGNVNG